MVIKRVGPVSCAKVSAVLYALIGLILGGIFSLFALVGGAIAGAQGSGGIGAIMGVGAIVIFPILYAFIGFVGTLIAAALYNLAAGMVGGIEMDVQ